MISEFQDACIRHPERVVLVIRSIPRISFRSSKWVAASRRRRTRSSAR